jgi:hypothetical protein
VLIALALGTGAYALSLRPDTAVPQPFPIMFVKLNFTSGHPATSPVTLSEELSDDENGNDAVSLNIDVSGADLAHRGWSLDVFVPSGVRLNFVLGPDPKSVRISQTNGGAQLHAAPGPLKDKEFVINLGWKDPLQGPMQLEGPNLHANFPLVMVTNEKSRSQPSPPNPRVTAKQSLSSFSDYVPVGGSFPDHIDSMGGDWSWKAETSRVNSKNALGGVDVEAQSPTLNEQAQNDAFLSGVVFGLAGAALIAAIQEFVSAATRKERRDTETTAA